VGRALGPQLPHVQFADDSPGAMKKSRDRQPIVIGCTATRPVDVVPALMTILQDEPIEVGPL
jgi:hypothetical protein